MSKRKYAETSGGESVSNGISDRRPQTQRRQIEGLLEHGKKTMFRSLKIARGFERQKLGRRQKTARAQNAEADIRRVELEVAALKNLNLATTAEIHLYKSLLKIKPIASTPSFPEHVRATVEAARKPLDTACANVQARLFKSKPVHTTMTETLASIRSVLGIAEVKLGGKKRLRAKDYTNLGAGKALSDDPATERGDADTDLGTGKAFSDESATKRTDAVTEMSDERVGLSKPEHPAARKVGEHSEDDREEYDIYATRLVASSDEESSAGASEPETIDQQNLNPNEITEDDSNEDSDPDSEASTPPLRKSHPSSRFLGCFFK